MAGFGAEKSLMSGAEFKRARMRRCYSQREFAKVLGTCFATIQNYEYSARDIPRAISLAVLAIPNNPRKFGWSQALRYLKKGAIFRRVGWDASRVLVWLDGLPYVATRSGEPPTVYIPEEPDFRTVWKVSPRLDWKKYYK